MSEREAPRRDPLDPRTVGVLALLLGLLATCLSIFVTRYEFADLSSRMTRAESVLMQQAATPAR